MTTIEERREIAAKLRKYAECDECENCDDCEDACVIDRDDFGNTVLTVLHVCGESYRTCYNRLADLIEPEPERKAKAKPFPVEEDTGFFDTTKCECGYLNDVSAKYCGQCGGVIEVTHYAD